MKIYCLLHQFSDEAISNLIISEKFVLSGLNLCLTSQSVNMIYIMTINMTFIRCDITTERKRLK